MAADAGMGTTCVLEDGAAGGPQGHAEAKGSRTPGRRGITLVGERLAHQRGRQLCMTERETRMTQKQQPDERDRQGEAHGETETALTRPASVDPNWDVKIRRAREAWEAGRRLRKDQPASPLTLFAP